MSFSKSTPTGVPLRRNTPPSVPCIVIVFLSGGQDHVTATTHLNPINSLCGPQPWSLSFSFGRALQDEALRVWHGEPKNVQIAQKAFFHRARCVSAAALGTYDKSIESELAA
jgi:fructose-bisphosphate aldolase class I